jgi:ribosomal protein S30
MSLSCFGRRCWRAQWWTSKELQLGIAEHGTQQHNQHPTETMEQRTANPPRISRREAKRRSGSPYCFGPLSRAGRVRNRTPKVVAPPPKAPKAPKGRAAKRRAAHRRQAHHPAAASQHTPNCPKRLSGAALRSCSCRLRGTDIVLL